MAWAELSTAVQYLSVDDDHHLAIQVQEERLRRIDHEIAELHILRETEARALEAHKARVAKKVAPAIDKIPTEILTVCTLHHSPLHGD